MYPKSDSPQTKLIDLSNCVLWEVTDHLCLNYLLYSLQEEMKFKLKVYMMEGQLCLFAAAIWDVKYGLRPINFHKMVIIEFESEEGVEYLTRAHPRYANSFDGVEDAMQPIPFAR